jgi:glycosyltransferase involved in cell wall biosynthesis
MLLKPEDISIGVTVYRRLDYLEQALTSAVNQTVPVKVLLHDDGCENREGLQCILDRFGDRVEYRRNPKTLGLFQNMNQCIWESPTPWVSVLHDDDFLEKDFVERILDVAPEVEACALFCGGTTYIELTGKPFFVKSPCAGLRWKSISAEKLALENQFSFPGQLIHVATAKSVGGFPGKSVYTGDWELWFKLTLAGGSVQLGANLSYYRSHLGVNRGTTTASKSGRKNPDCAAQVKRNLARLRNGGREPRFDRAKWLSVYGPLYRDLLVYSWAMPGWLLRYNRRLLLLAGPQGRTAHFLHWISKLFGNPGIRFAGLARQLGEHFGLKMPQTF